MGRSNTAGRGIAIAAGVVLASGTLAILFEDVLMHGAPFTLKHWLTLVTVAGTMMVGHLADLARRHRHWLSVGGFALLFLAGTGLVIYSSGGRQAEKTLISGAEHDDLVQKRNDLRTKLAADNEALKAKQEAADRECTSGDGPRCKGAKAIVSVYADDVAGIEARIEKLAPPKPVSAEAEQFANFAAALGYDKDRVRALAILLAPFFTTLFLEFGTIVSFGFAFSPKRHQGSEQSAEPANSSPNSPGRGGSTVRQPAPKPNRSRFAKEEAAADLVTRLALGERFASQDELAGRYGVAKSTMSDWLRDWEEQELIPSRRQTGRCKAIASN